MADDSKPAAAAVLRDDFHRSERIVVLLGSAALGLLAGCLVALAVGRSEAGVIYLAAPVFVIAFYLSYATLRDAAERKALGCTVAAAIAALSLAAWPVVALFLPPSTLWFWIPPALMIGSLVLLTSCWSGFQSAVYRTMGTAISLCAIAGFLGLTQVM